MAEYISKDKALNLDFKINVSLFESRRKTAERAVQAYADAISAIPVADVWEVVHCADCAHAEESLVNGCVYCNEMERARIKEGFCAWGERKES